jgi:hypothetical protein
LLARKEIMSDTDRKLPPLQQLKDEARQLVEAARGAGQTLKHGHALELVAHKYGFADWNVLCASGRASGAPQLFEPLEIPVHLDFSPALPQDPRRQSVLALVNWARRLETFAENGKAGGYPGLLGTYEGKRPYLFELNSDRWPDKRFHLVDRGYNLFNGMDFERHELDAMGLKEWGESRYCAGVGIDAYPVMDDRFMQLADRSGLRRLARLLVEIAVQTDARGYADRPGPRVFPSEARASP